MGFMAENVSVEEVMILFQPGLLFEDCEFRLVCSVAAEDI